MKNIRTMNTERRRPAAKFLLAAMLIAACSLLFLPGCQNPLRPPEMPEAGPGTLSLTIGGVARTIVPVLSVDRFERFAILLEPADECLAGNYYVSIDDWEPGYPIILPAGLWDITVAAYTDGDDDYPAAEGTIEGFEMTPGVITGESIVLSPIIGGAGRFSWDGVNFPASVIEATMGIFEWYEGDVGDSLDEFNLLATGGDTYISLDAGQYFVLFTLSGEGDDEAELGHILHIYRNIETELPVGMFANFVFPGPAPGSVAGQIAALYALHAADELPTAITILTAVPNEQLPPQALYFGGEEITITLAGGNVLSLYEGPGAMFTVGSGVTLVLDRVELRGMDDNNSALVVVAAGGTLEMEAGSVITGNVNTSPSPTFVDLGGGVLVSDGGDFHMRGGTISYNSSLAGGGVLNFGAGHFSIHDGAVITRNIAILQGGGVFNSGVLFTMHDGGIITRNSANRGGGVFNQGHSRMDTGVIRGRNLDGVDHADTNTLTGASPAGAVLVTSNPGQTVRGPLNPDGTFVNPSNFFIHNPPAEAFIALEFTLNVADGELVDPITATGITVTGVSAYAGAGYTVSMDFAGVSGMDAAQVSGDSVTLGFPGFNIPLGFANASIRLTFTDVNDELLAIYEGTVTLSPLPGLTTMALNTLDAVPIPTRVTSIIISGIPSWYHNDFLVLLEGGVELDSATGGATVTIPVDMSPGSASLEMVFEDGNMTGNPVRSRYTIERNLTVGANTIPFAEWEQAYHAANVGTIFITGLPAELSPGVMSVWTDLYPVDPDIHIGAWVFGSTAPAPIVGFPFNRPHGNHNFWIQWHVLNPGPPPSAGGVQWISRLYNRPLVGGSNIIPFSLFLGPPSMSMLPLGEQVGIAPFSGAIDGRALPADGQLLPSTGLTLPLGQALSIDEMPQLERQLDRRTLPSEVLRQRLDGRTRPEARERQVPAERPTLWLDGWMQPKTWEGLMPQERLQGLQ